MEFKAVNPHEKGSSKAPSSNGTPKPQKFKIAVNGTLNSGPTSGSGTTAVNSENGLTRRDPPAKSESNWTGQYISITKRLLASPFAEHFNELVDEKEYNYHKIVENPISLKEILKGLKAGKYASKHEVEAAYWLLFNNCFLFNPPSSPIFSAGYQLQLQLETERESNQPLPVYPHPPTARTVRKMLESQPSITNSLKERLTKPRAILLLQLLSKKDTSQVLSEEWEPKTMATLKAPVRLQYIDRQLKANLYGTCLVFYVDVQIMFENINFVYPSYSEKRRDAEILRKEFAILWQKNEKELQQLKAEMTIPGVVIPLAEKPGGQKRKSNDPPSSSPAVKKFKTSNPPSIQNSDSEDSLYLEDPLPLSSTRRQRAKNFAKRASETRKRAGKAKDEKSDSLEQAIDLHKPPRLLDTRGKSLKCEACVKGKRCCLFVESEEPSKCRSCKAKKLRCSTAAEVHQQIKTQKTNWRGLWIVPQSGTAFQHRTPPPEKGTSPRKWSVEQVCKWLEDNLLQELKPFFQQNAITGKKLLRLEVSDLATFNEKPRNLFLNCLFRLRTD